MNDADAERWQRAKAYIEREIETREYAATSDQVGRAARNELNYEIRLYRTILDRAEGRDDG